MDFKTHKKIIVIGSGIGGLVAGALLSKEGYRVSVLEKNKQIGGNLQSFGLDGKLFETAVHYIGSMNKHETLYKLYHYLGIAEKLSLQKLSENCYDEIIIENKSYPLAQGYLNFIEKLSIQFPEENENLQRFIYEIKNVCGHFPLYNLRMGSDSEKQKVIHFSLKQKLDECFTNEKLKQILCGNNLLFAGGLETTPFYIYALIQNSYIESSWKFKDGSAQLAKLLQDVIQKNGGEVLRNIDIKKIHESEGFVEFVEDENGKQYFANHFISNLHPQMTYDLVDSKLIKPITKKRIQATENTLSAFMVNVSLTENTIEYKNQNIYYHQSNNVWKDVETIDNNNPNSYAIFMYPDKNNPKYATAISVLCYMKMEDMPYGLDTFRTTTHKTSRSKKYETWKKNQMDLVLNKIAHLFPNLLSSIRKKDACTPLSYRDYLNIPNGSMYGFKKNVNDLANTTFSTRTKISNLHLTGQNINLHGILGASITSILTASEFVGLEYLVNKINKHNS